MRNHHPENLEVLVVNNLGRTPVIGNLCWHSDRSFLLTPTRYTILHGVVVGANGMGDTLFADMVGAYAEAPVDWKHVMEGAQGVHTYDKTARLRAQLHNTELEEYVSRYPPVRHPLVRSCHDPRPNTPALFISELCLVRRRHCGSRVDSRHSSRACHTVPIRLPPPLGPRRRHHRGQPAHPAQGGELDSRSPSGPASDHYRR